MSELNHECGVVAIYHQKSSEPSPLAPSQGPQAVSRLLPRMLLDIQNRGQLSAGITTYDSSRNQLIDTHRELGAVNEVFYLNNQIKSEALQKRYEGSAGIGHVRYATCGADDRSYAQPFERHHLEKRKWFSFCFNGQLANYPELRKQLLDGNEYHLARENDTEILMHLISHELSGESRVPLIDVMKNISKGLDGAYAIAMLNALGEMIVVRDPQGIKPMVYAKEGPMFAAASESVALLNLGFPPESIKSLPPGMAISINDNKFEIERFASSEKTSHCFFEWIYFANVASTLDDRSVYLSRKALGEELARQEKTLGLIDIDEDTIVVPVPDTSKAAADAMAFKLGVPSLEGLIRNRYSGRTFIESGDSRMKKAQLKYTPLREVLEDKKVILVEDSIVRSTTMKVLVDRIRSHGRAREIHVRVACPPIIAPCFYGIDMSTINELFAPKFLNGEALSDKAQEEMAKALKTDSLRYLPVESIARAIGFDSDELCQACITGEYPTPCGQKLYEISSTKPAGEKGERTYEVQNA